MTKVKLSHFWLSPHVLFQGSRSQGPGTIYCVEQVRPSGRPPKRNFHLLARFYNHFFYSGEPWELSKWPPVTKLLFSQVISIYICWSFWNLHGGHRVSKLFMFCIPNTIHVAHCASNVAVWTTSNGFLAGSWVLWGGKGEKRRRIKFCLQQHLSKSKSSSWLVGRSTPSTPALAQLKNARALLSRVEQLQFLEVMPGGCDPPNAQNDRLVLHVIAWVSFHPTCLCNHYEVARFSDNWLWMKMSLMCHISDVRTIGLLYFAQ